MRSFRPGAVRSWLGSRCAILVVLCCSCWSGDGTGLDPTGQPLPEPLTIADIQPIFTRNCAFSGCHGGVSPQLGQHLGAGQAYGSIVNVPSVERPGFNRVTPGLPDSSYLVHKIQGTHLVVGGVGGRMPLNNTPLSQAQIDSIRAWITDGALNAN